ncbi:hypothetical protein OUZ56_003479 [Daphnia magna]|uniref:Uncharacterized protein n=1 Tax=Daphnia magna TaxID=35525 RepID=A0ABR0A993_9CRUS|nr:hypothetical protein OUZ56_003479 [Daphnia magna]
MTNPRDPRVVIRNVLILSRLLRPHGLIVTSGTPVSAIDRNSTRDVRQSCQPIFLPVAAVYVSA